MSRLRYEDNGHKYYFDNQECVSVTTYIKGYFPKFVPQNVANALSGSDSLRYGNSSPDEIIEIWNSKAKRGTNNHEVIEMYLKYGRVPSPDNTNDYSVYTEFMNFWDQYIKYLKSTTFGMYGLGYESESRICDPYRMIAGTMDCLIINPMGECIIIDWKFIKQLYTSSVNKDEMGTGPFSNYSNCNSNHYLLQVNMYKMILESNYDKYNVRFPSGDMTITPKVLSLVIVLFRPQDNGTYKFEYITMPIVDLSNI